MRDLLKANRILIDPFSNVMGCRLPLQRRVHGQDHLVNAASRNPADQRVDGKILRSYSFKRRQSSAQDVEAPRKQTRLFERSEEHTSELQSLMRISYAVFCLKKTKQQ